MWEPLTTGPDNDVNLNGRFGWQHIIRRASCRLVPFQKRNVSNSIWWPARPCYAVILCRESVNIDNLRAINSDDVL